MGSHETRDPATPSACWSEERAEHHLRSLDLFGMRFGLHRMRVLMSELGDPERAFDSIHVLGTNGKSSTTRMIAAILARHGLRTASYTSPHLVDYRERVEIGERELSADEFAAAVQHAAAAAARVEAALGREERVTQFEELTAAAFWAIARERVQVAAIEAGLGGRYDATSVVAANVTVLTNVALEHTRWLGSTVAEIAEEKLAVVQPGGVLALGAGLAPEALGVAERVAREREARVVHADLSRAQPPLRAQGAFQRANFALARVAAEAYLEQLEPGRASGPEHERALREAAADTEMAGRFYTIARDPLTLLDGAHNPAAVDVLVDSLDAVLDGRALTLVFGVLEDKDAATMLARLLPACERAWLTEPRSKRARSSGELAKMAIEMGFDRIAVEPRASAALLAAQRFAKRRRGAVLATGSVYLVGELIADLRARVPREEPAVSRRSALA
ncbi:MAG TPA: cyanophycin synthetase [Solirubrobacteraceae bacterium]|nr:cyanophycin synthetase [Solirubrobacteraceae bacterium]